MLKTVNYQHIFCIAVPFKAQQCNVKRWNRGLILAWTMSDRLRDIRQKKHGLKIVPTAQKWEVSLFERCSYREVLSCFLRIDSLQEESESYEIIFSSSTDYWWTQRLNTDPLESPDFRENIEPLQLNYNWSVRIVRSIPEQRSAW